MKKRVLSVVLALTMIAALLAACGNTEGSSAGGNETTAAAQEATSAKEDAAPANNDAAPANNDAAPADEDAAPADEEAAGNGAVDWEDVVDIHVCYMNMGPVPQGVKAVEDAINEITEEEIYTHVTLDVYEIGAYEQQIGLMMASNEPVDLMVTLPGGASSFTTMRAQGQFMDITDLLAQYGQGVLDTVGDLIKATSFNGRIYAVPTYRNVSSSLYIVMRTDILEDLGLLEKAQNMTTMTEFEEIMEAVKTSEKWGNMSAIAAGQAGVVAKEGGSQMGVDKFSDIDTFDFLGDNTRLVCVKPFAGDNKVALSYDTQSYRDMIALARRWYESGYIYKDALFETAASHELVKSNVGFCYITDGEYGIEASASANCGMPMTCVELYKYPITTGSLVKFTWGITSTAAEPEAAAAFMNMMYTDSRIANLLAWGIEGVDYEVTDGVAHFIAGNENPAYRISDYLFGNQFLVLPWDGQSASIRQETEALMKEAQVSPYLGFMCDTESITNEISAISPVISEYRSRLELGMEDEAVVQEFVDKLKASGADKIVAAYQEQLDAWLSANQ